MPPWTILEDFDDVPEAKSPFSTSAVLSPRLAASSATPAPVTPPPMTSTSNSSSARRRSASSRRKGCTGQACHIRHRGHPGRAEMAHRPRVEFDRVALAPGQRASTRIAAAIDDT